MNATTRLSAFARMKAERLTKAVQEALHPIINDKGLVAARVVFLYEADGQMNGGSFDVQTHPGAGVFLDDMLRRRFAGQIKDAHKATTEHQQMVKS